MTRIVEKTPLYDCKCSYVTEDTHFECEMGGNSHEGYYVIIFINESETAFPRKNGTLEIYWFDYGVVRQ